MATYEDYRKAAALLWGPAGELAADEFARINAGLFGGSVPPLPIVVGLTAFGRCLGLTRGGVAWTESPRITLAPEIFTGNHRSPGGSLMVADVVLHEMIHAVLILADEDFRHNGEPWARMLKELSPEVLGREVDARPVVPRRIPNPARATNPAAPKTTVVRQAADGAMTRPQLATWPTSMRPEGYYDAGDRIPVPTY